MPVIGDAVADDGLSVETLIGANAPRAMGEKLANGHYAVEVAQHQGVQGAHLVKDRGHDDSFGIKYTGS